jgi:hypothetical protein
VLLVLGGPLLVRAETIAVSPGEDGAVYPSIDLDWTYATGPFGGSLRLASSGSTMVDDDAPGGGLSQSVTTVEDHVLILQE